MAQSQPKWITKSEGIKNIAEIVAILIAALWALFNYGIKDSPGLYQTTSCQTELHINSADQNHVFIELTAKIKNSGKQVFNVDSTLVEYWLLPIDSIKTGNFFSPRVYIESNPATYGTKDYSLSGRYSIEQEYSQVYNYILPADSSKMIIVRAYFYFHRKNLFGKESYSTYNYTYKLHCIPDEN